VTRRQEIDDLYRVAVPEQPTISPDGTRIVYVLRTTDREADRDNRALWQVPVSGTQPRQLTRGTADTAPAWSPNGTGVAFLRGDDGPAQLWLLPAEGGEPERLTTLPLGAGAPVWHPDGAAIAFTAPVDLEPGDDTDRPIVADRLDYQADGPGLFGTLRTHVHVLDLAGREVRRVTMGDWHADDLAWSPDGTRLAFTAARDADADLSYRNAAYVVDAAARDAQPELVGSAEGRVGAITWAGDALLVVGRLDTNAGHAALLRVPLAGGTPVDIAKSLDRNVMAGAPGYPGAIPRLTPDGRRVLFCVRDAGDTHLYGVDLAGGDPSPMLGEAAHNVSGVSVGGGIAAITLSTATSYGEIATVDLASGEVTTRTSHGDPDLELFVREPHEFAISDGTVVHGWLLRDPARSGPAPLLLDVHGGPHNAWNGAADAVHLYHQRLVARGWAVLLLNPRASDGYGEAFYTAGLGGWGVADAQDFLEPIDQLVAEGIADGDRLAITGYSYGGFTTCYLTGRDDRFAAAVAGGLTANLTSMAGTSDGGHYLAEREQGGAARFPEQDPWAAVDAVRTPTLILHGGEDRRCPVGQAQEWFSALRKRGVPTRMVLYPGASHLFILNGRPSHRADWNRRVVDWVERYATAAGRPRRVPVDAAHWRRRLAELATEYRVPGATLGIQWLGEDPVVASHGVLSKATGIPVTDDALFQIGSISKVWTTTLVMQLVDEGRLDLDAPIVDVLPELRLSDPEVTKRVTMRHLLSHTSGIDGDVFTDTGRGDDCVERYVELLELEAQNHPLGATFSYCNSGFVLAGRVIEKLTGQTWDAALRERLIAPLGLTHTVTLPEEALLRRAAVGHLAEGDADPEPASSWVLPRSIGPAGLIAARAADLLAFAAAHLRGGVTADGTRVLSDASTAAMTASQVTLPDTLAGRDSWGLGWMRFGWDGQRLIGHDGATIGQYAFLRILPAHGLAVTLLTNGGNAADLYVDLFGEIFAELAGVAITRPLVPETVPPVVDASRHLGTYERAGARIDVFTDDGQLRFRLTLTGSLAELRPELTHEMDLVPISDTLFVGRMPGEQNWLPILFYSLPTGDSYVFDGGRSTPKIS
jgi:dipeptidyl aminopeptidase/acylaminoacyl peptidase/CubicO group peptidase (beta-lactamase class C family)